MIQNRYLIVQLIGQGGMGEVYLAVDQRLGSAVALKRTFFNEDSALGNAFEREAKILARLRHPVLPKVIDHFVENGDQFLVMEHISGDDLAKRLEIAKKPFPLSWVMFWADQLLDALAYLHSHEPPIIHRDIKPENLKLTDENHIVLLDFGLSKDFDSRQPSEPATPSVVGYSPHYASMEQIRGTGTDARSDIFSLSATLYQLLTNTIPPDALTRVDTLLSGASDPIQPMYQLNSEVPHAISDVILKGLAVRQEERFTTAAEMQKALRRSFNKGDAASEAQTAVLAVDTQVATQEISTQTHMDAGGSTMDPTLHMDAVATETNMPQSGVKTEIFAAGEIPPQEAANEMPTRVTESALAATAGVNVAAAQTSPPTPFQPQAANQPPAKKSGSKTGLVIGGLVVLLLLAGIGAGGGWYAYTKYYRAGGTTATPTPDVVASPSPSATVLADANQNGNSNASVVTEANTDSNANRAASTTPTPGTSVATRSTPEITTVSTPARTTKTPTAKATPKPKGRDERTVILQ